VGGRGSSGLGGVAAAAGVRLQLFRQLGAAVRSSPSLQLRNAERGLCGAKLQWQSIVGNAWVARQPVSGLQ